MFLFAAAVLVAFVVRSLLPAKNLVRPRFSWLGLPVLAAAMQIALGVPPLHALGGSTRLAVVVLSYGIVGVWLVVNAMRQTPALRFGCGLITLGWLTNAIAIIANRGMPVSRWALSQIGVQHPSVVHGNLYKHVLAGPHSPLRFFGDCIPVALPLVRNVISVGDILVMCGVILCVRRTRFSAAVGHL